MTCWSRELARWVVVPLVIAATGTFGAIGDVSERGGEEVLLTAVPQGMRATATAAVVAIGLGLLWLAWWWLDHPTRDQLILVAQCASLGVVAGALVRLLGARTIGANIGGVMALAVAPLPMLAIAWRAVLRWRSVRGHAPVPPPD